MTAKRICNNIILEDRPNVDNMVVLKQTIQKSVEFNLETHIAFSYFEKRNTKVSGTEHGGNKQWYHDFYGKR